MGASTARAAVAPVMAASVPGAPELLATHHSGRNRSFVICAPRETGGHAVTSLSARVVRDGNPAEALSTSPKATVRIGRRAPNSMVIEVRATNQLGASAPLIVNLDPTAPRVSSSRLTQRSSPQPCAKRQMVIELRP
jgi:hypothetical protein